jgi:hypothetical protein
VLPMDLGLDGMMSMGGGGGAPLPTAMDPVRPLPLPRGVGALEPSGEGPWRPELSYFLHH